MVSFEAQAARSSSFRSGGRSAFVKHLPFLPSIGSAVDLGSGLSKMGVVFCGRVRACFSYLSDFPPLAVSPLLRYGPPPASHPIRWSRRDHLCRFQLSARLPRYFPPIGPRSSALRAVAPSRRQVSAPSPLPHPELGRCSYCRPFVLEPTYIPV